MVLYPSLEKKAEPEGAEGLEPPAAKLWPDIITDAQRNGRIMTDMQDAALVDAIRALTYCIFPNRKDVAGKLATEFSASARTEPLELEEGIILIHAHVDKMERSTLAIGVRESGWNLVALSHPIRIVLVLCSPSEANPQVHLDALTELAYAIRDKDLSGKLLGAADEFKA
jgi:hypothetical protein